MSAASKSTQTQDDKQIDDSIGNIKAPGMKDSQSQTFRFLDLPKDIRRMVYDVLPEQKSRSLHLAESNIGHMDYEPQVDFLQTSQAVYDEAKPSIEAQRLLNLPTQKCVLTVAFPRMRATLQTSIVLDCLTAALARAHLFDVIRKGTSGSNKLPSSIDDATLSTGIQHFQHSLTVQWGAFFPVTALPYFDTDEFKAQFNMMLLQLRHDSEIEVRYYARGTTCPVFIDPEKFLEHRLTVRPVAVFEDETERELFQVTAQRFRVGSRIIPLLSKDLTVATPQEAYMFDC
ncbi:hypothetical protein NX059_002244 [Plenodomus lindquistii]|nr:hypothetical protein NX059_002244 [Plenodomus lindquistii]